MQGKRGGGEVDLHVAAGEPESTVVAEAPRARAFGVDAPVATLEHLPPPRPTRRRARR